jgi:DNA polymerase I-like protein with 3'-5' exonuclease and polymerase domains|tara:strand:+ start:457 stop:2109 length:1653 start_codon:yes stop_codon:yes gene_type:complete
MKAVVDIETDSLNAKEIHCIVAKEYDTGKTRQWVQGECGEFREWSKRIDTFIMHNGISFDAPVLNRLTGSDIKLDQIRDTLIESQLYNPVRDGGHSLEAWGKRLRSEKIEHNDYRYYTPEMLEYCKQDVNVTQKLAVALEKEGSDFSSTSYDLERKVRSIVDLQQENGFAFDIRKGMMLEANLLDELYKLEEKAHDMFPPDVIERESEKTGKKLKDKVVEFNIASRIHIADRLERMGVKFTKRTETDRAVINESVLDKIDLPEAQMFSRYFLLQKRTGLLKSWIQACSDEDRVHGRVLTLKTITGRMAHYKPNMAQVPAVYSPYGKECRELWTVSNTETHQLVGTDASGLELRCLAHYMDDDNFTNEVLTGDVHTANQKAAGLQTRDQAKTFIYAFLYGAGPGKIGTVVGGAWAEGEQLIEKFLKNMPYLNRLRKTVTEAAKSGRITGLDGRKLHIRHEHAALNTLLQGAGAVVCKRWLVEMDRMIWEHGLDAKLVASVHDEYQFEVAKPDIESFTKITKDSIKTTEEILNFKCNLDSDYKVGNNWAETH